MENKNNVISKQRGHTLVVWLAGIVKMCCGIACFKELHSTCFQCKPTPGPPASCRSAVNLQLVLITCTSSFKISLLLPCSFHFILCLICPRNFSLYLHLHYFLPFFLIICITAILLIHFVLFLRFSGFLSEFSIFFTTNFILTPILRRWRCRDFIKPSPSLGFP